MIAAYSKIKTAKTNYQNEKQIFFQQALFTPNNLSVKRIVFIVFKCNYLIVKAHKNANKKLNILYII